MPERLGTSGLKHEFVELPPVLPLDRLGFVLTSLPCSAVCMYVHDRCSCMRRGTVLGRNLPYSDNDQMLYWVNILIIAVAYCNGSIYVTSHSRMFYDIRLRIVMWKTLYPLEIIKILSKLHVTVHTHF